MKFMAEVIEKSCLVRHVSKELLISVLHLFDVQLCISSTSQRGTRLNLLSPAKCIIQNTKLL